MDREKQYNTWKACLNYVLKQVGILTPNCVGISKETAKTWQELIKIEYNDLSDSDKKDIDKLINKFHE